MINELPYCHKTSEYITTIPPWTGHIDGLIVKTPQCVG